LIKCSQSCYYYMGVPDPGEKKGFLAYVQKIINKSQDSKIQAFQLQERN